MSFCQTAQKDNRCPKAKEKKPEPPKAAPAAAAKPAAKASTDDGPAAKPAAAEAKAINDDGKMVTINLTGNDQMQYNLKTIEVAAGRKVTLNLTQVGKMPKAAMGHNFVLLKAGENAVAFAATAVSAAATGYIPEAGKDKVIAHTKVLGGGESDTITFDAPAAGTYPFVCTFPGHGPVMNGTFVVK